MLFGVFAVHSPESCPLNNDASKNKVIKMHESMEPNLAKFNIERIVGSFISALEHQWVLILDAKSAHEIEKFCIHTGISSINTIKIVPLNNFEDIVAKIKSTSH